MDPNVDYLDSANWDSGMAERLRWLREHDPVYWAEKSNVWVLTRYADVVAASKDQEVFTSRHGVRADRPIKLGLIDEAEPRHTQLRKLINKGFTPRMVKKLESYFRNLVTRILDDLAPRGHCDFVEEIAVPLPLLVIAEMMGIPPSDRDTFHKWSDDMIAGDGNFHRPEIMARAGQAFAEYAAYVTQIIEDRRRSPQDDLITILANAKDEGVLVHFDSPEESLPSRAAALVDAELEMHNDELIKLLVVLLVAGNETTRNAISGGMQLLIESPDVRDRLVADRSLIPAAVEEMLRLVSPVHTFSRTVTRDTRVRDKDLRPGDKILLVYPSANRDAEQFPEPDRFDIDRHPAHVAFGIGSHFCLGANLARMEMRVAFDEILRRLPDIAYAGEGPELRPSALVRSCMRMDVRYTPA